MGEKEEEEAEEEAEEEEEENEGLFKRQKWDRTVSFTGTVSFTEPFAASKPDLVSIDRPATTGGARQLSSSWEKGGEGGWLRVLDTGGEKGLHGRYNVGPGGVHGRC